MLKPAVCLHPTTPTTTTARSASCTIALELDTLAMNEPPQAAAGHGQNPAQELAARPSPDVGSHTPPPPDDEPAHTKMAMRSGSTVTGSVRKVSFACTLQVFEVEKLCFADLRGNVRDLSVTCEDPDWCSIGVARANKLADFAENFMLRKVFCVWSFAAEESAACREHPIGHERGLAHTAATLAAAHREQLADVEAEATAAAARLPANLFIDVTATSPGQAYYMYTPFDPFLPSFPQSLNTSDTPARVISDEDDDWSDWDSESQCSSVRQSIELLRSQS